MTTGSTSSGAAAAGVPGGEQPSIGQLVNDASTHLSTMVHGEIELAKLELRSSVKKGGASVGFFVGAAVLLVFSLTFGLIALAEGLIALGIWPWAAFLIVFGLLLAIIGVLVVLGIRQMKRVKGPERTIAEGKQTMEMLKHPTQATHRAAG
jgi:uncharacterized membrane protein YqjE